MESELQLTTENRNGKTIIKDVYFTAPYKIMSPFERKDRIEIMQMSATAGMLGGDTFHGDFFFGEKSHVLYTSQSYEKVFHTKGKLAKRRQRIHVAKNASVCFMPYPVIPFANSNYDSETSVYLDESSCFLFCDIFTCGRTGMGEYFEMEKYRSRTQVYVGDERAFVDYTLLSPKELEYRTLGMWGEYTHNGMLYCYPGREQAVEEKIEQFRQQAEKTELMTGVTECKKGLLVRALGTSGDKIFSFFQDIADLVEGG